MNLKSFFPISAMLLVGFMGSCTNELDSSLASGKSFSDKQLASASTNVDAAKAKTSTLKTVSLGVAGEFAILSKAGITDVYKSTIKGDIGTSPITGAAIKVSCAEVVGTIFTVDAAGPLPCRITNASRLTTSVSDMETAYTDAAGRPNPDFLNLGAGDIGGKTLKAGLYKFTTAVVIPTDITISGSSTDVWIFQVAGTLNPFCS